MLYFVENIDNKLAFVVKASDAGQARIKASDFTLRKFDKDVPASNFAKVILLDCEEVVD